MPPQVREAAKEYVQAAAILLAEACHDLGPQPWMGGSQWVRETEDRFVARERTQSRIVHCIWFKQKELGDLAQWSNFVAAVRATTDIAYQLDQLIGTPTSKRRVSADEIHNHLLLAFAHHSDDVGDWVRLFDAVYGQFETDLQLREFDYVMVSPLLGLRLEAWPVSLEGGLEMDRLTDPEIADLLHMDALPSASVGMAQTRFVGIPCGVRMRYPVPKLVGDSEEPVADPRPRTHALAYEVLEALRIFKRGRVTTSGYLHYCQQWPQAGSRSVAHVTPGTVAWANVYELKGNALYSFPNFWRQYRTAKQWRYVASAVRRFGLAGERERDEDRLVDLMIAAESLFLSGGGSGESSYRLAMRTAFFVDVPGYSRHEVYRFMGRASRVRNSVVHGGTPDSGDLRLRDQGVAKTLGEFADAVEDVLRLALHKAIETNQPQIDWEKLITAEEGREERG